MFAWRSRAREQRCAADVIRKLCLQRSFNLTHAGRTLAGSDRSRHRRRLSDEIRSVPNSCRSLPLLASVLPSVQHILTDDDDKNIAGQLFVSTSPPARPHGRRHRLWVRDGICRRIDRYWQRLEGSRKRGRPMSPASSLQLCLAPTDQAGALTQWPRHWPLPPPPSLRLKVLPTAWRLICDAVMTPRAARAQNERTNERYSASGIANWISGLLGRSAATPVRPSSLPVSNHDMHTAGCNKWSL